MRHCYKSGHHSVLEFADFTFKITGVSRALTHQLVRHRCASYAQRSQRYCKENNFEYPVGKLHEDFALTSLIMLKAKKVASTNVYGYYYYQSSSSITRGNDQQKIMKRALDMLYHYDYMNEKIKEYNISKQTLENLKIYYTNNIILKIEDLNKINQKYYIKEIKKRKILKNIKARNLKQLLKKIILNINIRWYLKLR